MNRKPIWPIPFFTNWPIERLFVAGDTDFNEAFATMVAQEGVRRWFEASHNARGLRTLRSGHAARQRFCEAGHGHAGGIGKSVWRRAIAGRGQTQAQSGNHRCKCAPTTPRSSDSWGVDKSGYDDWFAEPINNAKLNTVAAYYDFVPAFQALLRAQGGNLEKFYKAVKALSKRPLAERHEALRAYLNVK